MKTIIPIPLKRIAVRRMQDVESGKLSHLEGEQFVRNMMKVSREEIVEELTRQYDQQLTEALQFFRLL